MKSILEINNMSVKIGSRIILDGITFTLEKGEVLGLVGLNGAGKTTIMKAIVNINPNYTGVVKYHGLDISAAKKSEQYRIGSLIENSNLYPYLSGIDHLKLYSDLQLNKKQLNKILNYS